MSGPRQIQFRFPWHNRSVRAQLLAVIVAINVLAACVAAVISIFNIRTATKTEIDASLELAQRYVSATLKDLADEDKLGRLTEILPHQLKHLRHVRILMMDSLGKLTVISPLPQAERRSGAEAPGWFTRLVSPDLGDHAMRMVAAEHMNPIVILGDPRDEIAEAWTYFYSIALVWLIVSIATVLVLSLVMGRVLGPLAGLSRGMANLEEGEYGTRLSEPRVKELAVITRHFNRLASRLGDVRQENSKLYRQLITVQEQERREIASELHDEAGPYLFGITANASSIRIATEQVEGEAAAEITDRAGEIVSTAQHLKTINRSLLKKLRPGPLGRVPLAKLIEELIAGLERRHPSTRVQLQIGDLANSYGESIDLTLYRCIQECMANAVRGRGAGRVSIALWEGAVDDAEEGAPPRLHLALADDGWDVRSDAIENVKLAAMVERVRSLAGACTIASAPGRGATIEIEIPIGSELPAEPRAVTETAA